MWLTPPEVEAWHELVRMLTPLGLFTEADRISLSLICEMLVRYRAIKAALQVMSDEDAATYGVLMKTKGGNVIQNPMVGALNKVRAQLSRELQKFGMDPSSRSQIEVAGQVVDPIMKKYGLAS